MDADDAAQSSAMMAAGAAGRTVTRILIDFAVTLQFSELKRPSATFVLEAPFGLAAAGAEPVDVHPGELGQQAVAVAALFGAVLREVDANQTGVLTLRFEDGSTIEARPDPRYESWSYVSDDGGRVICAPGGRLDSWDPVA